MTQVRVFTVETWLGPVYGAVSPEGLCALTLPTHDIRHFALLIDRRCPGAEAETVDWAELPAGRQVAAFFERRERALDAPLDLRGLTPFAQAVMREVCAIPYGRTATYGQVAQAVARPGAARAVGQVMHHNPIPLFVP